MSDKELLGLAAKAAGINAVEEFTFTDGGSSGVCSSGLWDRDNGGIWNPLANDGAALRLAVKLARNEPLCLAWLQATVELKSERLLAEEVEGEDPYAATRRAIVRAAANIGKDML